jgi:hypothetical protein
MIYLFWALLNIALFLYFIFLCLIATKLIREKINITAAIFFVVAFLSYLGSSNTDKDESDSNQKARWQFIPPDSIQHQQTGRKDISLEKTWISNYSLSIKYSINQKDNSAIPISAYATTGGFISGTTWKPMNIILNKTNHKNTLAYAVDVKVEWQLMGSTVYSQLKTYKGLAIVK